MDELIKIAEALALLSASALCIYLIVVLVRLNSLLESLQKDFADLARALKPVLENLVAITERIKSISTKIDDQVRLFHTTFDALRRIVDNVVYFEERIQQRLEEPFVKVSSILSGLLGKLAGMVGLSSRHAD